MCSALQRPQDNEIGINNFIVKANIIIVQVVTASDKSPLVEMVLLLLVLLIATGGTGGSYCMATDCSTTGSGLSLYLTVCCVTNNLGRSHTVKGNGITRYILCPKVAPKSSPPPKGSYVV